MPDSNTVAAASARNKKLLSAVPVFGILGLSTGATGGMAEPGAGLVAGGCGVGWVPVPLLTIVMVNRATGPLQLNSGVTSAVPLIPVCMLMAWRGLVSGPRIMPPNPGISAFNSVFSSVPASYATASLSPAVSGALSRPVKPSLV